MVPEEDPVVPFKEAQGHDWVAPLEHTNFLCLMSSIFPNISMLPVASSKLVNFVICGNFLARLLTMHGEKMYLPPFY